MRLAQAPYDDILDNPISAYSESIRSLQTALLLSDVDHPPKIVLIASSVPEEGKTSLCISLARTAAKMGRKVILVDVDLRRPQIHEFLELDQRPGLVDVLAGNATIDDALCSDEASGALVLTAGSDTPSPIDLLGSENLKATLSDLAGRADIVILDSAPVLSVSDTRVLSHLADKTVYIVRWAETRREVVILGLKQILDAGASVAGVILSRVNIKKHARYGYGDSGYYYGRSRKYYRG